MSKGPIPENEVERLLSLGNLDLDYTDLEQDFKHIVALTAKISGMDVSLINLIDPFTQWTIAWQGFELDSMPREESVCQYTIMGEVPFEVTDLSADERFRKRAYVSGPPNLKYYLGIPLTTEKGVNIGSLCVLDAKPQKISPERIEILKILAHEVVSKLKNYNTIATLKDDLLNATKVQKKIAQDVRDPLSGIIGISEILLEQQRESDQETLEYISLINESSRLILEITDSVLIDDTEEKKTPGESFNMFRLKQKLNDLYVPLAENKKIQLSFNSEPYKNYFPIPKSCVLQIAGMLISSAIKLLPPNEKLTVDLDINVQPQQNSLNINVTGSSQPQVIDDMSLYNQVMGLTVDLVKKLDGKLMLMGESDKISYSLSLPFSA